MLRHLSPVTAAVPALAFLISAEGRGYQVFREQPKRRVSVSQVRHLDAQGRSSELGAEAGKWGPDETLKVLGNRNTEKSVNRSTPARQPVRTT
jgi:hypothetical protein